MLLTDGRSAVRSDNYGLEYPDTYGYCEPEELANIILAENPDAIKPFNTYTEMVEYIREAMASNYIFRPKPDLKII